MKLRTTLTTYQNMEKQLEMREQDFLHDAERENQLFILYPEVTYQTFEGFGGAATDSAGYVYHQMSREQKDTLIKKYFSEDKLNYQHVRVPLDSCDFSLECYEAMSNPEDLELNSFTLERAEKYIFPLLDDIQNITGKKIPLMVSPWSPPAFMKTNGQRNQGGKLKPEYKDTWAEYICRYIMELQKRGYVVERLSIQNEPKASQTWDSCIYTAEEEREFLKEHLYPALSQNKLTDIEIYIWDHNKERVYERACGIINEETRHMIAGIAFHWYSGDHFEALQLVRERYPEKKLILSEACIEFSKFSEGNFLVNAQKYAHDIIGNINHGMTAFYDWNMLLDEKGGPNHVQNYCDAPFRFHEESKELHEGTIADYLHHFCHFIKKGAVRIGLSRYDNQLEMMALKNLDGTLVVILLNQSNHLVSGYIKVGDWLAEVEVPAQGILTGEVIGE